MPVSAPGSIAGYLQDVCHEQHLPVSCEMCLGLESGCFFKTFSLLSPCWDRAMSCEWWVPSSGCVLLRKGTRDSHFPLQFSMPV